MKRINRLKIELLLGMLLAFLLFPACTDDSVGSGDGATGTQGKTVGITLSPSLLQISGGVSRSVGEGMNVSLGAISGSDTRAVTEDKIENVCVFQFAGSAESSTAVLKSKIYKSNLVDRTLDVPLVSSTECFLCVCANVGDITADYTVDSSTYQDLMNASLSVSGQGDFSSLLPMCGASTTLNLTTLTGNISVNLTRLVARVSFTCDLSSLPTGASFSIINATLRNVPKSVGYVAPVTGTLTSTTTVDSYVGTGATVDETAKTTTYVWYMPENLRGTGTTISVWKERTSKNAPVYSTYLELTGYYTPLGGEATWASYVVYLGNATDMNNYDVERNHAYSVTATIKGVNLADGRVSTSTDLSADGLSNCYLASTSNHWYRFTGTTRGNGNATDYTSTYTGISIMPSVVASASDAVTIPVAQIADAVIVWETSRGLINPVQWDATSGCIRFKTGDITAGNAVIAVRDASQNILWSWHIWRTNGITLEDMAGNAITVQTNVENHDWYTVGGTNHERKLMDRNLGASGTTETGNIGIGSLQYQFGRKDPFVGPANYTTATEQVVYDGSGSSFVFSTKAVLFSTSVGTNAKTTIDYSIKNPEKSIFGNASPYNWINTAAINTSDWKVSNCLWGDNNISADRVDPAPWDGDKTIYDPCPIGWRVAPADIWTGVLINTASGTNAAATGWDGQTVSSTSTNMVYHTDNWTTANESPNGHTFYFNGDTGTATFCPASGLRGNSSGELGLVGSYGYGWLSAPGGNSGVGVGGGGLSFNTGNVNVAGEFYRAYGFPVRCVQE